MVDRRSVLLGLAGASLSGCAAPGSAVYQVIDSYRALNRAKAEYPVTRAQIDAQPLGVLGVQVEGGLKGLMLWEKREAGLDYWRSGNGVSLVLKHGRIIRSEGFPLDQLNSELVEGEDPIGSKMERMRHYELTRSASYSTGSVIRRHSLKFQGDILIDLLNEEIVLDSWNESLRGSRLEKPLKQVFQVVQSTGQVKRSVQHVSPETRVILELLKPPSIGN